MTAPLLSPLRPPDHDRPVYLTDLIPWPPHDAVNRYREAPPHPDIDGYRAYLIIVVPEGKPDLTNPEKPWTWARVTVEYRRYRG